MDENRQVTNSQSDELDLLSLIGKASSFFQKFGKTIILFSVVGFIIGLALYFLLPKQYESKLILHSSILTNEEEIEIIETWSDLLEKGEYASLSRTMNVTPSLLGKLTEISATEIQKLYSEKNPNGFIIEVLVKDTAILDELQKGIIFGLENSDYVRDRVMVKKANLNDLIQGVKGEIARLDVTKTNVQNLFTNKSSNTSSLLIDVSGMNTTWVELNEKLRDYEEDLRFINAVQLLQGFNKLSKPEEPKLLKLLFFGVLTGAFVGYLVALYKYVQMKLKTSYVASR